MLNPIPCNLFVLTYTEKWKGVEFHKVILTTNKDMKETLRKAKNNENDPNSIRMTKTQYENVLKPLFENIKQLNQQIYELQKEGD